jgi:hypothetical protein
MSPCLVAGVRVVEDGMLLCSLSSRSGYQPLPHLSIVMRMVDRSEKGKSSVRENGAFNENKEGCRQDSPPSS